MKDAFWVLEASGTSQLADWSDSVHYEDKVSCPLDSGHSRPGRRSSPLNVVLPSRPGDFIWTWMSECLVQDRVVDLFEQDRVSGYALSEGEASFKKPSRLPPPRLRELLVRGWGGLAPSSSGVKLLESCPGCGHRVYSTFSSPSKLIDPSAWDGSDVFMVWPLPRFIFVTTRVAGLIERAEQTGAALTPISQLCTQGDTLTPGSLSDWFPREEATRLSSKIGIE
jgi:hypothetical protein